MIKFGQGTLILYFLGRYPSSVLVLLSLLACIVFFPIGIFALYFSIRAILFIRQVILSIAAQFHANYWYHLWTRSYFCVKHNFRVLTFPTLNRKLTTSYASLRHFTCHYQSNVQKCRENSNFRILLTLEYDGLHK